MIAKRKQKEMLEMTTRRLLNKVPKRMRGETVVQERIKIYTKLGKERLAREYIKTLTYKFPEISTLVTNPIDPPLGDEETETVQTEGQEDQSDTQHENGEAVEEVTSQKDSVAEVEEGAPSSENDAEAGESSAPTHSDDDQPAPESPATKSGS